MKCCHCATDKFSRFRYVSDLPMHDDKSYIVKRIEAPVSEKDKLCI
jgi:hypothetical protein